MTLKDEVIKALNSIFERSKINIKFESMLLFRPVVREPPFENMEVIHDAKRILFCNPICSVFELNFYNRHVEYEVKYQNDDGKLSLASYKLRYCEYRANEDPKKVEKTMDERIKIILLFIAGALQIASGKKRD